MLSKFNAKVGFASPSRKWEVRACSVYFTNKRKIYFTNKRKIYFTNKEKIFQKSVVRGGCGVLKGLRPFAERVKIYLKRFKIK
jgi:hypothetical protein